MLAGVAMIVEAGLSFVGLGAHPAGLQLGDDARRLDPLHDQLAVADRVAGPVHRRSRSCASTSSVTGIKDSVGREMRGKVGTVSAADPHRVPEPRLVDRPSPARRLRPHRRVLHPARRGRRRGARRPAIGRGQIHAVVGESGSGKSVTALAIMGLLPPPAGPHRQRQIVFDGRDLPRLREGEMRDIRGSRPGDGVPGSDDAASTRRSTVGDQIAEVAAAAPRLVRARRPAPGRRAARRGRHPEARSRGSTPIRTSSPAACASG